MTEIRVVAAEAAPAPIRRGAWSAALPMLSVLVGLLLWEAAVRALHLPSYLLPAPSEVADVIVEKWRILLDQARYTIVAAAAGFAIALAVALVLGAVIAASPAVERLVSVWLVLIHAVPKVVIAPLLLVWIGFGLTSSIVFVVVFTFFPILVNTATGLRSADPELLLLARSMGATRWQLLRAVRLPSALPGIIVGVKVAITLAPAGAVIGEFVASNNGLGHMLIQSVGNLEVPTAFAAVAVVSALGILVWYLAEFIEAAAIPWHASQRSR